MYSLQLAAQIVLMLGLFVYLFKENASFVERQNERRNSIFSTFFAITVVDVVVLSFFWLVGAFDRIVGSP